VKRYQSPLDAAHLPKNELNHNFAEDTEPKECPDNACWINELPHTRDGHHVLAKRHRWTT
jgi:hypothetical protein